MNKPEFEYSSYAQDALATEKHTGIVGAYYGSRNIATYYSGAGSAASQDDYLKAEDRCKKNMVGIYNTLISKDNESLTAKEVDQLRYLKPWVEEGLL